MNKRVFYLILLSGLLLILVACGGQDSPEPVAEAEAEASNETTEGAAVTNAVSVDDQSLSDDGTVTVASVTSDVDGWIVIHAQAEGRPGPIIGWAPVQAGENQDVMVEIDSAAATGTLYAMLHVDAGTAGTYEFPGDDVPATDAAGNVVTPPFELALPTVKLSGNNSLGEFLVGNNGMTLYLFTNDEPGASNCNDGCATAWPPLSIDEGDTLTAAEGISGALDVITRGDGTLQVTYNDIPLYFWANDAEPGDTTGNGVNDVWFVVDPTLETLFDVVASPTIKLGSSDELGEFLVGDNDMTLYRFANDEPGMSNCNDGCAEAWPPLLVEEGDTPTAAEGISGELGVITRGDDTLQVTYNDMPLYFWASDAVPGDTTGHGVNDVWFVVEPAAMESALNTTTSGTTVMLGGNDELGEFLVDSQGMTLYRFANDEPGVSNCNGGCAEAWPPLLVGEDETPTAEGLSGELGVITRDDGTLQVTYNDMPLYFWASDAAPGDTTGHGVNDVWFVVEPAAMESALNTTTSGTTVMLGGNDELGEFLVDSQGMTLYLFANDEPGASNCNGGCAAAWPPLLIEEGDTPTAAEGVSGKLDSITRADGTLQVTYNDLPLYLWANDAEPGDATGHGVNDVWFVAEPGTKQSATEDTGRDYDYGG
jgi:predicted lipoprotein with Yx(FWY)xxD motif